MIKIWNRPKVEFSGNVAYSLDLKFRNLFDNRIKISDPQDDYWIHTAIIKENQTFEQAVNEWVENYVKRTFQPIVLPDEYETESSDEYDNGCVDGRNNCIKELLEQNPNIIIEEVQ